MEEFVIVLSIIWSILCLILFFKIWGMTNNVDAIRRELSAYLQSQSKEWREEETISESSVKVGDKVLRSKDSAVYVVKKVRANGSVLIEDSSLFGTLIWLSPSQYIPVEDPLYKNK